ncbi:MAG TPA: ATP-binding protein [Anaerolineales bacterium]|nr:ATP-binding protein [Anaerolineales bacterium]
MPWRGLIWQLFVITILPLAVLTVVITFGSLTIHQQAMRALVGNRDERAVRTAAAALEEQLSHRQDAIRSLALLAEKATPEEFSKAFSNFAYLRDDFDSGLAFFSPEGLLESYTGDQQVWEGLVDQVGPMIRELLEQSNNPVLISSAYNNPANQEKIVLVLAASSERNLVAAGASSAADLMRHTLTNSFASGSEASVVVVDANKDVLYQGGSFSYIGGAAAHPGVAEALRGESGVTYVEVGDSEHVVTYSPIGSVGWALALEEPWETVDTPTLRTTQLAPLVLVPVLLLTLLALWFGLRSIVKPLQALESKASTLAWGEFDAIEQSVGGIAEIRRLQYELIHMARKVKAAQQSLHSYIGAITSGQEEERRRLARELHDDTIQSLIALKRRVELAQLASKNGTSEASLVEVVSLTEKTIENVRRQTRALRPIYLEDLGLVTALEMLARETSQAANIPIDFQRQGTENRLNPNAELALYRMAQEALNNVIRHAQASQANLGISFTSQEVTLYVSDNGRGFDVPKSPAEFAPGGHFGLLGMYERAELIGARLEIHSTPEQGSQITVRLPV